MAKVKNYHVYGDGATVSRLKDEYDFLGRYCKIVEPGHLVVFAHPPKKEKNGRKSEKSQSKDRQEAKRPRKEHSSR